MSTKKIRSLKHCREITDTLEYALFIIKPDAMICKDEIIQILLKEGFYILSRKKFQLFPEQAAEFLKDYEKLKNFMILVYNLSNGPIEVMLLSKDNCIEELACLIGPERPSQARHFFPESLRAIYGNKTNDLQNAVHGSRCHTEAIREIHFFFPNFIIEPISTKDAENLCCKTNIIGLLFEGLHKTSIKSNEEKLQEPIQQLAKWWLENNPEQPIISEDNLKESYENLHLKDKISGDKDKKPIKQTSDEIRSISTQPTILNSLSSSSCTTVFGGSFENSFKESFSQTSSSSLLTKSKSSDPHTVIIPSFTPSSSSSSTSSSSSSVFSSSLLN